MVVKAKYGEIILNVQISDMQMVLSEAELSRFS
jgi:hypothetical protein